MRGGLQLGGALASVWAVMVLGQPSDQAMAGPRTQIGRTGFSEVSVPQVKGRVPAQAISSGSAGRKFPAQALPEGGAINNRGGAGQPETCGPENADTPACRNTAAQQSHR